MTQIITKTYEIIRDTFRYYKTIQELSQLSDKELYDLGLTRQEIVLAASRAVTTK